MNKEKFWKWTTFGLLLLNIIIVMIVFTRPFAFVGKPPRPDLSKKLHLNQVQSELYNASKEKHRNSTKQLVNVELQTYNQLFELMKQNPMDSVNYNLLINQMIANKKQMINNNFSHFYELRNICNAEQQQIFDNEISKIMFGMNAEQARKKD